VRTLVLFDVDGTLISTSGQAFAALVGACAEVLGKEIPKDGYSPAGKTDPQIFSELLARAGLGPEQRAQLLRPLMALYQKKLPQYLQQKHVRVLEGASQLLPILHQNPQVALGLLTGNLQQPAQYKLELAGLWHFFPVGAFGSDHADRHQLLPYAVARAEAYYRQKFPLKEVLVVGDTPLDVSCAQVWGAKAVAVAGHTTSMASLALAKPQAVLPNLSPELFLPVFSALREASP
jgi:phosphoglycolate phosphatase-like HAD superfamily hydrolase